MLVCAFPCRKTLPHTASRTDCAVEIVSVPPLPGEQPGTLEASTWTCRRTTPTDCFCGGTKLTPRTTFTVSAWRGPPELTWSVNFTPFTRCTGSVAPLSFDGSVTQIEPEPDPAGTSNE